RLMVVALVYSQSRFFDGLGEPRHPAITSSAASAAEIPISRASRLRITTNIQHLQNGLASVGALFSLDKDAARTAAYSHRSQRGGSRGGCTDKVSRDARRSVSRTSTRHLVSFPLRLVPGAQRRLRTLRSPAAAES